jgi:HYDIN/CFA65/VesB-like, Ig-like domain/Abnormal spindle-like microcephaly-assoc'd, ASPM-SPD-2-Hydin
MASFPQFPKATLVFLLFAGVAPFVTSVRAQSTAAPAAGVGKLTVAPSVIYFGNVIRGQVKHRACTVSNTGSASLTISRAYSNSTAFTVATPHLPAIVPAGGKAVFTATFAPQALVHSDADIIFASNASNRSVVLPIHGTGVQAGTLRAAPSSVSFGSVLVGSGGTKSVAVTNVGFSNVKISSDAVVGFPFSVSGLTLPITLTPSQSITFTAKFAPAAGGVRSGSLTLHSSATNSSLIITLSGTALPAGSLAVSPAILYFGSVATGANSYRSATLQAVGGTVLISSAATGSAEFALTGVTFPLKIASGQSATLALRFTPQIAGLATASLKVKSNAVNTPVMALQGHGLASTHSVALSWTASKSAVVGYNIYRGTQSGGPYSKINPSLETATSYSDTAVVAGDTYYYVTTAMGSDEVESTYSSQVGVTIPTN